MLAYVLLIFAVGFIAASAIYIAGVIFLAGHKRWVHTLLVSIGTSVIIYVFIRIIQIEPPQGIFSLL